MNVRHSLGKMAILGVGIMLGAWIRHPLGRARPGQGRATRRSECRVAQVQAARCQNGSDPGMAKRDGMGLDLGQGRRSRVAECAVERVAGGGAGAGDPRRGL